MEFERMRDKLIELIIDGENELRNYFTDMERIEHTADYLIAHGVTMLADVPDNNVGDKLKITVELKTTKIIASHLRKDFPFSANIIAAQIAHDLMAQGLLEVE